MKSKTIWEGRSSPLLYLYTYLGLVLLSFLVQRFIGGHMLAYATPGIVYFTLKARSMRYAISDQEVYFSPSLGDPETISVPLGSIQEIQVVDRQPWTSFRLGTLILITNPEEELHPCMKCVKEPHKLARRIRRSAQELGASRFPIETV